MTSPSVEETELGGSPAVHLTSGDYAATFLPHLGMLGASLSWRGGELLVCDVDRYREGHTTGLPLLHPWANRLAGFSYASGAVAVSFAAEPPVAVLDGLPIHGTMAAQPGWEHTVAVDGSDAVVRARFDFGARPALLVSFPFPHVIEIEARLGAGGLAVSTEVAPTGDRAVPISFGWHPYFALPGVDRAGLSVVLPARDHDVLDERMLPTGRSVAEEAATILLGDGPGACTFDDAYRLRDERVLAIEGAGLRLSVDLDEHYPHAQVYAPAGQRFAALEPMTAPINALVSGDHPLVEPGHRFAATFTVRIEEA